MLLPRLSGWIVRSTVQYSSVHYSIVRDQAGVVFRDEATPSKIQIGLLSEHLAVSPDLLMLSLCPFVDDDDPSGMPRGSIRRH